MPTEHDVMAEMRERVFIDATRERDVLPALYQALDNHLKAGVPAAPKERAEYVVALGRYESALLSLGDPEKRCTDAAAQILALVVNHSYRPTHITDKETALLYPLVATGFRTLTLLDIDSLVSLLSADEVGPFFADILKNKSLGFDKAASEKVQSVVSSGEPPAPSPAVTVRRQ
jgi:hypothetical protein